MTIVRLSMVSFQGDVVVFIAVGAWAGLVGHWVGIGQQSEPSWVERKRIWIITDEDWEAWNTEGDWAGWDK